MIHSSEAARDACVLRVLPVDFVSTVFTGGRIPARKSSRHSVVIRCGVSNPVLQALHASDAFSRSEKNNPEQYPVENTEKYRPKTDRVRVFLHGGLQFLCKLSLEAFQ